MRISKQQERDIKWRFVISCGKSFPPSLACAKRTRGGPQAANSANHVRYAIKLVPSVLSVAIRRNQAALALASNREASHDTARVLVRMADPKKPLLTWYLPSEKVNVLVLP